MLGVLAKEDAVAVDALLAEVARRLADQGLPVAGAVQISDTASGRRTMTLRDLGSGQLVPISQELGAHARGCVLDSAGLETAVGLAASALGGGSAPALLIVNRFGKQEAEGRGFRPLIGEALSEGIPVLVAVGAGQRPAFEAFAGPLAETVPAEVGAVLDWLARHAAS